MQFRVHYVSPTSGVFEGRLRSEVLGHAVTEQRGRAALDALDGIVSRVLSEAALEDGAPARLSWASGGYEFEDCEEFSDKSRLRGAALWEAGEHRERLVLDVARTREPFLYSVKFFAAQGSEQLLYVARDLEGWLVSCSSLAIGSSR